MDLMIFAEFIYLNWLWSQWYIGKYHIIVFVIMKADVCTALVLAASVMKICFAERTKMNNLNIKINNDISENLLNMNLTDMFCKHVIRRNPDGIQIKAGKLYIESCKLGYKVCNWGLHVGHASDIQYHINSIVQMERDGYNPAIRVVICKYDFCEMPIVWIDNLHSAIKYIREYGKNVKLGDIPFYVVDISDYDHPSIHGYNGSLRERYEDILGAVSCAYKRFRRSNSKKLIEIGYTVKDFLYDNPMLYTELNTHLDLINR